MAELATQDAPIKDVVVSVPTVQPVELVFDSVTIDVKLKDGATKRILDSVSGRFGPSEVTAVMGPSGSGKTTMLNALTGVMKPSSGSISVNGKPFDARLMKKITALVPQDDLLTPVLTCREALMEAAAFKTACTPSEAQTRVNDLLDTFGLVECADVTIGHPEGTKGLSGGQKKRLSVALELMGSPSLLFLDEPTSGLDAVAALSLVQLLSTLARKGATIISTIHQPSSRAFFQFDKLLLLAKGKTCYFGPVSTNEPVGFFRSAGFVCPEFHNPADFVMEVLAQSPEARAALQTAATQSIAAAEPASKKTALTEVDTGGGEFPSKFGTQFKTLLQRNMRVTAREPGMARARVGSAVLIGVLMGILYFDLGKGEKEIPERLALLLFSMIFLMLTAVLPTVLVVLPELAVMKKEFRNNWYDLRAFYGAKLVADTPLLVLPPLLYLAVMGGMTGLWNGEAWRFGVEYASLLVIVVVCQSWALVISCSAPSLPVAIFSVPISVLPMILFAGFFMNVSDITWAFRWICYISPLRYAWEIMCISAFYDLPLDLYNNATGTPIQLTGNFVLTNRLSFEKADMQMVAIDIAIIIGFTFFFRAVAYFALRRRVNR